jgi:hypothetical protein
MRRLKLLLLVAGLAASAGSPAAAQAVMLRCGQQYQSAKAAGTLNGMGWSQFRTECAARLKAQPADAAAAAPIPAAAPAATATPPSAAGGSVSAPPQAAVPASAGRAAMLARQKQCGAEWRAQKATLVAQTPGLKWPSYWSQCNTRLKAAGR